MKDLFDGAAAEKVAWTARMIGRLDADVLALQEVGSAEIVRLVLSHIAGCGYGEPVIGTADARGIRCALVSRRTVLASRVHTAESLAFPAFHAQDPPPFAGRIPLRRGIVHARIDAGDIGPVEVMVAHFKSRRPVPLLGVDAGAEALARMTARARAEAELRSLVWRAAEGLYLRGLVDECLADPGARMCITGDFNDVADSATLMALRGDGGPGALSSCARGVPSEERYSILHGGERAQIDHILVTSNLAEHLTGARFFNEELREHGEVAAGAPEATDSDHAPFVAEFKRRSFS